jgi:serine hydrolase
LAADAAHAAAVPEHRRGRFVNVGAVGHLNPAAGYGEWPQAEVFVRELCEAP